MKRPLRYVSMFSGIECASVAFRRLAWKPLAFSEVDPFACAVLEKRHPGIPNLGDMTQADWGAFRGKADVVISGPPCQAFSVAGLRESLGDSRGNLSLEYVRAIHEIDPKYSITENVPGWLSTKDNAFGCCLAGLVGIPGTLLPPEGFGSWPCAGMVAGPRRTAAWRILNSQHFGLAQRRKRVYVITCRTRDRINPGAVLFELESLPGHSAQGAKAGKAHTSAPAAGIGGGGCQELALAGAVSAKWAKGTGGPAGDECYKLLPVAFSCKDYGADAGELSPTLRAMSHHSSHSNGGGQVAVATMQISPTLRADGGALRPEKNSDAVVLTYCPAVSHTLKAAGNDPQRVDMATYVVAGWAVRRLTPRECEKLQGLPDDYTLIPYVKGSKLKDIAEMAAYWGVSEEEASTLAADSHRYRAIGNGMSANVIAWIGRRIEKVERVVRRASRGYS